MKSDALKMLDEKIKELCKDLLITKKENLRLARLLLAAEAKVKKLTSINGQNNIINLSKKIEKLKNERKIIKSKVEKMVTKLDKFYGE